MYGDLKDTSVSYQITYNEQEYTVSFFLERPTNVYKLMYIVWMTDWTSRLKFDLLEGISTCGLIW